MPVFVFHFERQGAADERVEVELPGRDAACAEAVAALNDMLRDMRRDFWEAPAVGLRVTDEAGDRVCG